MAAKAGSAPASNRTTTTEDNKPPGLTVEEREHLLLVHLAQGRKDNLALEAAMEVVRGVRKARNKNRNSCQNDGFALKLIDEVLTDEAKDRVLLETEAELRTFMRRTAGLPITGDDQMDLFPATTSKGDASLVPDDLHYKGIGYAAGLRGDEAIVPDYVPHEHGQAWLQGRMEGQTKLSEAFKTHKKLEGRKARAAAPPAPPAPVTPEPAPESTPPEPAQADPEEQKGEPEPV